MRSGSLHRPARLNVVLFSGGRGSSVLSKELINNPAIALTLAVNGYDDGLSTGEVRRFLGDSLGPSDFRKNATRLSRELRSCPGEVCELLELRLPAGCQAESWQRVLRCIRDADPAGGGTFEEQVCALAGPFDRDARRALGTRLERFEAERASTGRAFEFSDCSLGNLVFAGSFLEQGRRFNAALDDFCGLVGLPPGLIDNVTEGTNAFLVALDLSDRILGSEGEIVDAKRRNYIKDIYLIDHAITSAELEQLRTRSIAGVIGFLEERAQAVTLNPRLRARLD
ncbi:MAG: hypothetical protein IMZ67_03325, partial [Acidobacteria bacterium]|nr:hypothetical protein [Acidobacteriota bacterium]